MQAYSFTNTEIAAALAAAHDRGVKVRAIFDKDATGDKYSGATYCSHHNIACFTDGEHPIAHNKVIILDGQTVITGSFNFTKQAERSNAENLLILTGKRRLAAAYQKNFDEHFEHSKKYEPPTGTTDNDDKRNDGDNHGRRNK
jgi:phosphatidylserine/phosphatidylglycerophosphate/cardiolipin synthase-like enzyme